MSVNNRAFVFRKLDSSAIGEILDIENEVQESPWSAQKFLSCFGDDLYLLAGLYVRTKLAGYAVLMVNSPDAELHNLAISKTGQNSGFATLFLTYLIDQCVRMSIENLFLEVRESNTAAINAYKKSGFIQVGLRQRYYQTDAGSESALILKREIAGKG